MESGNRILLLGATGRTGRLLLNQALDRGMLVNCLVRDAKSISKFADHPNCTVHIGNASKLEDLTNAITDCSKVISVLNISRVNDFPWAKLRTPSTFLSSVMKNLLFISRQQKIDRMVVCSAWGVSETKKDLPAWFRWVIDHSNVSKAYEDHERQESLLPESDVPWTVVRPVGLTNGKKVQDVIVSYENNPKPKMTINRSSLAKFMLDCLYDDRLVHKMPTISAG